MKTLELFLNFVASKIWGNWLIIIFLGVGVFFTIITGFIQIRKFPFAIKEVFGKKDEHNDKNNEKGDISSLQALYIALSSCVGNGNIVGVGTSIIAGGPGAIFWMWISSLLGCATKYGEIVIGMIFREKNEIGNYVGGPLYYISNGLNSKFLSATFAILLAIQSSGGNLIQSNALSNSMNTLFGIPKIVAAILLAFSVGLVIIGGINGLAKMSEKIVPIMSILYLVGGLFIIVKNINIVPATIKFIIDSAFTVQAGTGAMFGYSVQKAMQFGISRGLYSNEAGEGSAPAIHAPARVDHPVRQGLYGIIEVIIDTIVCTITALSIIMTGVLEMNIPEATLALHAFETIHPFFKYVVGICMILFAYTSIPVQWYLGNMALGYLLGANKTNFYKYAFVLFSFIGCLSQIKILWALMDIILGIMVIPNLIAIVYLSPLVYKETIEFFNPKNGYINNHSNIATNKQ